MTNFNDRRSTTWIRTSSHKLNIEVGRYSNIDRSQRTCEYCFETHNLACIEDENHLLLHCPIGKSIREKFQCKIDNIGHPIDDFHIAQTCPISLLTAGDANINSIGINIIRNSCNTIQRLYSNVLKFKKDLAYQNKAAVAGD